MKYELLKKFRNEMLDEAKRLVELVYKEDDVFYNDRDKFELELDNKFKDAVDKNEVDASDKEAVKNFKEKLQQEIASTWASKEEQDLINEFYALTIMVEPVDYVVDEKLPGIFNISMRDDKSGLINYKKK